MVRIADNGTGFNPSEITGGGGGLSIMRGRMNEIGGEWKISSEPVTGTVLEVRYPIR
ncbi:MAG: hypothetical protein R3281_10805 [Balneolaceae bacterium]|nr:hypothetical protein [Balneolaceae bacterium]